MYDFRRLLPNLLWVDCLKSLTRKLYIIHTWVMKWFRHLYLTLHRFHMCSYNKKHVYEQFKNVRYRSVCYLKVKISVTVLWLWTKTRFGWATDTNADMIFPKQLTWWLSKMCVPPLKDCSDYCLYITCIYFFFTYNKRQLGSRQHVTKNKTYKRWVQTDSDPTYVPSSWVSK